MLDVDMNLMPPKVIGREACLQAKGLFRLSEDPRSKWCPNTWGREESKEIKNFVKVEDGGVHHKKYNGRCTKQWIKIPKATWTSPILGKRFTCWTSFNKTSLVKDDLKVKVPNRTPKFFIPSDKMVNWDGVLKFGGRLEGEHVTHLWS